MKRIINASQWEDIQQSIAVDGIAEWFAYISEHTSVQLFSDDFVFVTVVSPMDLFYDLLNVKKSDEPIVTESNVYAVDDGIPKGLNLIQYISINIEVNGLFDLNTLIAAAVQNPKSKTVAHLKANRLPLDINTAQIHVVYDLRN